MKYKGSRKKIYVSTTILLFWDIFASLIKNNNDKYKETKIEKRYLVITTGRRARKRTTELIKFHLFYERSSISSDGGL